MDQFKKTESEYKNLIKKLPIKKVTFKGKTVTYRTLNELKTKLKLSSIEQAREVQSDNVNRIILKKNGDFGIQNFSKNYNNPLILRNFGINRITNKDILNIKGTIKDNIIEKNIKSTDSLNLLVYIDIKFTISNDEYEKHITRKIHTLYSNIPIIIYNLVDNYMQDIKKIIDPDTYIYYEAEILSEYTEQKIDFIKNQLRKLFPLKVEDFDNVELNNNKDCVKVYLKNILKKMSSNTINKLGNELGVSIEEIITFCQSYKIEIYVYSITCEIRASFVPIKRNKSYPILVFLAYDNHLYPVKNRYLQKRKHENIEIEVINNTYDKLVECLNNNIKPSDINYLGYDIKNDKPKILSFITNNKKYIQNPEYNKCLEILTLYGLKDKMFDGIQLSHIFNIIERIYVKENTKSFLPGTVQVNKGGYNYKTTQDFDPTKISVIDKNKCYAKSLESLEYLIKCDYRTCKINKNPTKIIDHYLYIAKPKQSSILLPNTNLYAGYDLKYAKKQGIEFELLEEMTTTKINFNYYSKMIRDLYKNVDESTFKKIMVIGIGKMEMSEEYSQTTKILNVFPTTDLDYEEGFPIKLNDKYTLLCKSEEKFNNLHNKKPIAIQIKDRARRLIYEKMKELNLNTNDIIQIKTDSIAYIGNIPSDLDYGLDGWKEDKKNTYINVSEIEDNELNSFTSFKIDNNNKYKELVDCYAGVGKTWNIINELIPKLEQEKKQYIVLTPSHNSGKIYKQIGINHKVIHCYSLQNKIPFEDIVIIDEFGFCDKKAHDMLYKCFLSDKEYYAYGDFKQLLPIENGEEGKQLNSLQYLDLMFNNKKEMIENRRNYFTKEYYDKLINNELNIEEEVKKYSIKKYYDAEVIICWRNKTVDKYNNLMMKYLKLKEYDIGLKLICKTNDLLHKDISNNSVEKIMNIVDNNIILSNGECYTKDEIKNNFLPAYARTCYGIQGESIESYYYAPEDYYILDGRKAYTIISRLKTK